MASRFSSVRQFMENKANQNREDRSVDSLVKQAQLKELGYDYQPRGKALGIFGGGADIVQNPNYVSTKDLERQKLQNELDPEYEANRAARKEKALIAARREAGLFGQPTSQGTFGSMPGVVGGSPDTSSPFVYDPITGTQKQNPSYLDPLEKERLAALEAKKQEAVRVQKNKEEMLRQDAESQLQAIQESKKGAKYFGPMGNLPSIAAPSSLPVFGGEYGPRKEWENNTNKLLSGRIIDLMNKMKSASKTGATGFGALNQKELALIQSASNVLSKDLPPDQAMKYLNQLESVYQKMLSPSNNQTFGQSGQQEPSGDPLEAEAQAAIASGADPKAVMARLAQLRGQRN